MRDANPKTIFLKDYQVPDYLIHTVDLTFDLTEDSTLVKTQLSLVRNPSSTSDNADLVLMGENLVLHSVALDGQTLSHPDYLQTDEQLIIANVPQQREFTLTIENSINPKANTALEGLYLSNGMLCTQCEAEGFRKITYFLDRPDVMSRYTTTIIGDKQRYPVLLSNGNKTGSGELSDNKHWVSWQDPFNKPCYLFALVAGQLECIHDTYTTQSGRLINLEIFVEPHDRDKCAHAMQSLKYSMAWDEEVYGREYDLDLYMIVAVSHFNMGAMENKGLNIFNTKFVLARPDTATDYDYEHIESVIAHEYFHNWTGNRITCRDWFQLSLKEGFTVFRDQQFTADRTSKAVKRIEDVINLRTRQFAEDAGPLAHPVRPDAYIEINNFYTLTVYEKGAEVVRMLHTLLGEQGFRKGCDWYFAHYDGQAVTCDDFVLAMTATNPIDLEQFKLWYTQAGTPILTVTSDYDATAQSLTLNIHQHCPATPGQHVKKPMHIPVRFGLIGRQGTPIPCQINPNTALADELILELTQANHTYVFSDIKEQPVMSLLRGFSAPVKLVMERSLDELAFLLNYDTDTFSRWDAGQQLSTQVILGLINDIQNGVTLKLNPILIDAFQNLLAQSWHDLSYFSLLLSLPSETYLAEQMPIIDVVAIHKAREFVTKTLAEHLQQALQTWYLNQHRDESGCFNAEAIGRRRIKNTCLHYLTTLDDAAPKNWAHQQFKTAKNMTDQMAALSVMVNNPHYARRQCLMDFYQQWQHEPLVIDKWFSLQASSPGLDTYDTVLTLLKHPAFDLKTPNRVRALIGSFSQGNPLHFHAANGTGYQLLSDIIIELNSLNPQLASRMLNPLTTWRRYDDSRQALMIAQLERIIATEHISRDLYEVASKSLS